jgi:hypothetical protein
LLVAFTEVEADEKQVERVREMTNAAGKILGTLKIQLVYAALRGEKPLIEFLGATSGLPLGKRLKILNRQPAVPPVTAEVKSTS